MNDAVRRARALIGVPFRFQGRDVETGLDCVGLVIDAFALDSATVIADYDWRMAGDRVRHFARIFFEECRAERRAGDVLLARTGRERRHLAIWTGRGVVHADAVLGRVVERQGQPPWPIEAVLRRRLDEEGATTWRR